MSLESTVKGALDSIFSSRVYPDVTPDKPVFPLAVYQQVGGDVAEYVEGKVADIDQARVRVTVWSRTRLEADSLARQARVALVEGTAKAITYGAPIAVYDDALKLYGSHTDFGLWYSP